MPLPLYDLTTDSEAAGASSEDYLADGSRIMPDPPYAQRAGSTRASADRTTYFADGGVLTATPFDPATLRRPRTNIYLLPVQEPPCVFQVRLPGGTYTLRLTYVAASEAGWLIDIGDVGGRPLACGIPLITGADLLDGYGYLGFGGRLFVLDPDSPPDVPSFEALGVTANLYFEPNPT